MSAPHKLRSPHIQKQDVWGALKSSSFPASPVTICDNRKSTMSAEDHKKSRAPETLCVHAGEEHHGTNESLTTEISQGSVFVVPNTNELRKYAEGDSKAYLYSRYANPTVAVAERKIAALEGAESAVVTSSGMAAIMSLVLSTCRTGDEIVSMLDLYGGTTHLLQDTLSKYGVTTRFVPYNDLCKIEDYFTKKTRLLFLETPTNPTLRCVDIAALAKLGHQKHTCVVVDNTFASPMLQRPLELGADVVVHSATKLLGGHNDVTAGADCRIGGLGGTGTRDDEAVGRMFGSTGRLSADPRAENTGNPRGTGDGECAGDCGVSGVASEGVARVLSGTEVEPEPRDREETDVGIRDDAVVRAQRRRRGRREVHRFPKALVPGDEFGGSGVDGVVSVPVVARGIVSGTIGGAGCVAGNGAAECGN